MEFYLGPHHPGWLARTAVPLFVSRRHLAGYRRLPRARGPWALDSGGFSELSLFGHWSISVGQYAEEVRRFAQEIGGLRWAAAMDWMCEPAILARTGATVLEHQRRTIANYRDLLDRAPDLPWAPVVQGWTIDDYRRHVDDYDRAGVDLRDVPEVGLGSVCRRQHTAAVEQVVRDLGRRGLRLHGFGFKVLGLRRLGSVLASADSASWSFRARRIARPTCGSSRHANCANCLVYALAWRERLVATIARTDARPRQLRLLEAGG